MIANGGSGIYKATGNVIAPTINDGDCMFVGPIRKPIQRGDIVIIEMPKAPGKAFVTRVVGLPGETIEIRNGRVIVDGAPIDEPYVDDVNKSTENFGPGPVPTGRYFVLGDGRRTVMSGRAWGHVREADVTGADSGTCPVNGGAALHSDSRHLACSRTHA